VCEQRQAARQRSRIAGGFHDQGHATSLGEVHDGVRRLIRGYCVDSEGCDYVASPQLRLNREHLGSDPLQHQAHQDSHRPLPRDDNGLSEHLAGVKRQLQRRLDQGKQGRLPWVGVVV
jgi:hypothetical protein